MRAAGERHPNHKLTQAAADAIRRSRAPGSVLASKFACSEATVSLIRTGKAWKPAEVVTADSRDSNGTATVPNNTEGQALDAAAPFFPKAHDDEEHTE